MTDAWTLNGQLARNLEQFQHSVFEAASTAGAGKAHQAVAQSAAIAVQDATDALRNMTTVSTVAVGTMVSQLVESGDPKHLEAIRQAQAIAAEAANNFGLVGRKAAMVLQQFEAGAPPTESHDSGS